MNRLRKKILFIVTLLLLSLFTVQAAADSEGCLYYFYGIDCEECANTDDYINTLGERHDDLQIESFEVYQNRKNAKLLEEYFTANKVDEDAQGLPVVFVKGSYFVGAEAIRNLLEPHLEVNNVKECPSLAAIGSVGVVGEKSPHDVLDTLQFGEVTSAALSDSLRPAMVALLLILLGIMLALKDEDKVVERGVLFIIAVFGVYFLFSFGWFVSLAKVGVSSFFAKIIGVIIIIGSLITIQGFFGTWKRFLAKIPEKYRWLGGQIGKGLISPVGVVIVGFVLSLFTLAGMDNVYLVLQSLMTESGSRLAAIPLTLYYLILIVLPLIVMVAVFKAIMGWLEDRAKEKGPHDERKVTLWRKHQHKVLNFSVSIVMLVVGLVLLFV